MLTSQQIFNIIQVACISSGKDHSDNNNWTLSLTKLPSNSELGFRTPCTLSQRRTALQLSPTIFRIPVLRQEHRRHNEAVLPFPLPRYFPSKELPHNLLGSDRSYIGRYSRTQLHYYLPMHSGEIFMGQDCTRLLVSRLVDS